MSGKSNALTGIAGAYFVAAELSQRGYIATVTSRNTEGIDVLASALDGSKTVSIQVKTSAATQRVRFSRSWILARKHEDIYSPKLFYVFVDLHEGNQKPDFYVVPSKTVADYIRTTHQKWLKGTTKTGKARKDSDMRLYEIWDESEAKSCLNNWRRLRLD